MNIIHSHLRKIVKTPPEVLNMSLKKNLICFISFNYCYATRSTESELDRYPRLGSDVRWDLIAHFE
jgi:hypothetical protein